MSFNDRLIQARGYRYPLTTEKLINGAWVAMARFQEPRGVDMTARVQRHVEAVGGRVRLLRGDLQLAEWVEGEPAMEWEVAS